MLAAGVMLWRGGVETSGRELESIQKTFECDVDLCDRP
jgi:hypothetical protein